MDTILPAIVLALVALSRVVRRVMVARPSPPAGPRHDLAVTPVLPTSTGRDVSAVPPAPRAVEVRAAPVRELVRPPRPARTVAAPDVAAPRAHGVSRRLDVRRDLIAAELLAPPVSLRLGGALWR